MEVFILHIRLKNMDAWNDDPLVIQAIKEKIDVAMAVLSEENGQVS